MERRQKGTEDKEDSSMCVRMNVLLADERVHAFSRSEGRRMQTSNEKKRRRPSGSAVSERALRNSSAVIQARPTRRE